MKCDACSGIFCGDHISYSLHTCPSAYKKDMQVPVCPLCNRPIPTPRGQLPDMAVGRHIDRDCQSDPAVAKRRIYNNRCSFKGCKQKELVPIQCSSCRLNFCLKHRHESDHACGGFHNSGRAVTSAAEAAIKRSQAKSAKAPVSRSSATSASHGSRFTASLHGNLTEDEALAQALQLSLNNAEQPSTQNGVSQEEADRLLSEALQRREYDAALNATAPPARRAAAGRQRGADGSKGCAVS